MSEQVRKSINAWTACLLKSIRTTAFTALPLKKQQLRNYTDLPQGTQSTIYVQCIPIYYFYQGIQFSEADIQHVFYARRVAVALTNFEYFGRKKSADSASNSKSCELILRARW